MPLAILVVVLSTGFARSASAGPAATRMVCGDRGSVVAELTGRYGETRRSTALQQGRGIVEIYASDRTGSWTMLLTDTAGRTCLIAAGGAFEAEAFARSDTPA